jgi:coenzyme F420-0:L-glutamate ligase / coenzyme F420-1:gamma-L-glutamate ligase
VGDTKLGEEAKLVSRIPELISRRRTVRALRSEPVPIELIDTLLGAAWLAPSAHNRQPWRFVVVSGESSRHALAYAMANVFRQDLEADGRSAPEIQKRVSASTFRLSAGPVLILACLEPGDLDQYPDATRKAAEHTMGVQSVAAAIENLLLAAADAGLGAGWMCAPLFCQDVVRGVLALPCTWEPQALITIGWPVDPVEVPARFPSQTRVVYR